MITIEQPKRNLQASQPIVLIKAVDDTLGELTVAVSQFDSNDGFGDEIVDAIISPDGLMLDGQTNLSLLQQGKQQIATKSQLVNMLCSQLLLDAGLQSQLQDVFQQDIDVDKISSGLQQFMTSISHQLHVLFVEGLGSDPVLKPVFLHYSAILQQKSIIDDMLDDREGLGSRSGANRVTIRLKKSQISELLDDDTSIEDTQLLEQAREHSDYAKYQGYMGQLNKYSDERKNHEHKMNENRKYLRKLGNMQSILQKTPDSSMTKKAIGRLKKKQNEIGNILKEEGVSKVDIQSYLTNESKRVEHHIAVSQEKIDSLQSKKRKLRRDISGVIHHLRNRFLSESQKNELQKLRDAATVSQSSNKIHKAQLTNLKTEYHDRFDSLDYAIEVCKDIDDMTEKMSELIKKSHQKFHSQTNVIFYEKEINNLRQQIKLHKESLNDYCSRSLHEEQKMRYDALTQERKIISYRNYVRDAKKDDYTLKEKYEVMIREHKLTLEGFRTLRKDYGQRIVSLTNTIDDTASYIKQLQFNIAHINQRFVQNINTIGSNTKQSVVDDKTREQNLKFLSEEIVQLKSENSDFDLQKKKLEQQVIDGRDVILKKSLLIEDLCVNVESIIVDLEKTLLDIYGQGVDDIKQRKLLHKEILYNEGRKNKITELLSTTNEWLQEYEKIIIHW